MPAFSPSQQAVLLEVARLVGAQLEDLRKTLARMSVRLTAIERVLDTRGEGLSQADLSGSTPPPETPQLAQERQAADSHVLRRIITGEGVVADLVASKPAPRPSDRHYTADNAWLKFETFSGQQLGRFRIPGGQHLRVGITPEASGRAGSTFLVEVPRVGAHLRAGDALVTLRSATGVTTIGAPVAGQVVGVNDEATSRVELLVDDPYGGGWLVLIAPREEPDTTAFLSVDEYEARIASRP
jgi:glycine cleavage system H protein